MSEPSAEVRERATQLAHQLWPNADPDRWYLYADPVHLIACALGEKDAALARAIAGWRDDYRKVHTKWMETQADFAAMREALERIEHVTDDVSQWDLWRVVSDVHQEAETALALSPGAVPVAHQTAEAMPDGQRETARDVMREYEKLARQHHSDLLHVVVQFEECQDDSCVSARALLARSEVQRWAGR